MYFLNKIFNPGMFQGKRKKKSYFEGWYFKTADSTGNNIFAIIPGISYGKTAEDNHSFIQVINAKTYKSYYFKFSINSFKFSKSDFEIFIDKAESNLDCNSKIKANQIRTIDKIRLIKYIGTISEIKLNEVENAILIHLGI